MTSQAYSSVHITVNTVSGAAGGYSPGYWAKARLKGSTNNATMTVQEMKVHQHCALHAEDNMPGRIDGHMLLTTALRLVQPGQVQEDVCVAENAGTDAWKELTC